MFWLCATGIVAYNVVPWTPGATLHVTFVMALVVLVYALVGLMLWRRARQFLAAGLILGMAGMLLHFGAAYFILPAMWPDVANGELSFWSVVTPLALPALSNLVAVAALIFDGIAARRSL